jgi:hypothetical protein
MTSYVRGYLDASLRHLQVMSETYDTFYISGSGSAPGSSEEETVEIPHLICPLFDFVSNVVRGGKAKEWLQVENLNSLVSAIFSYSQMTADDVRSIHVFAFGCLLIDRRKRRGRQMPMLSWHTKKMTHKHMASESLASSCYMCVLN